MNKKEKEILKQTVNFHKGILSPAEMEGYVCKRDTKSLHRLIASNYIETFPYEVHGKEYNFYRATEKGILYFSSWHKKIWYFIKQDLRTILVAVIISVITTIITLWINNILNTQ